MLLSFVLIIYRRAILNSEEVVNLKVKQDKGISIYLNNHFVEAEFKMSVHEMNLLILLYWVALEANDFDKEYTFEVSQISDLLKIPKDSFYSRVKMKTGKRIHRKDYEEDGKAPESVIEKLLTRSVTFITTDENGNIQTRSLNWVTETAYSPGPGLISFGLNPALKKYINEINHVITYFRPEVLLRFKSFYTKRIYLLLKGEENDENKRIDDNGEVYFEAEFDKDYLTNILMLSDEYSERLDNFKSRILAPIHKEIGENSKNKSIDIKLLSFPENVRVGRKVSGFKFRWGHVEHQMLISDNLESAAEDASLEYSEGNRKSFDPEAENDMLKEKLNKMGVNRGLTKQLLELFDSPWISKVISFAEGKVSNGEADSARVGGLIVKFIRNQELHLEEVTSYLVENKKTNRGRLRSEADFSSTISSLNSSIMTDKEMNNIYFNCLESFSTSVNKKVFNYPKELKRILEDSTHKFNTLLNFYNGSNGRLEMELVLKDYLLSLSMPEVQSIFKNILTRNPNVKKEEIENICEYCVKKIYL